jgi:hypothetical protein
VAVMEFFACYGWICTVSHGCAGSIKTGSGQ